MIMKEYEVYVDEVLIGKLIINEEGKYCYTAYEDVIAELAKKVPVFYQLVKSTDGFVDTIPVLYNRITNCARFGETEIVHYPGDDILLKLVK